MKIMVLNGVNMNMLGIMDPEVYGEQSYAEIMKNVESFACKRGHEIHIFQSNHEGKLIDYVHSLYHEKYDGVIFNPGALCHTSYALKDAIKASQRPCIEVHLENCFAQSVKEQYRSIMITGISATAIMFGCGAKIYELGIKALESILASERGTD